VTGDEKSSAKGQSYRELVAWQRAVDLVEAVYRETQTWPREEIYGLTNQARRAAVSIPANIAEGQGRVSAKEFGHHLVIAYGSVCELETHLVIAMASPTWTHIHSSNLLIKLLKSPDHSGA
jgi:four helix bundle protein